MAKTQNGEEPMHIELHLSTKIKCTVLIEIATYTIMHVRVTKKNQVCKSQNLRKY